MAPHVRERLLQRTKQGQLGLLGQGWQGARRREPDVHVASCPEVRHERAQRRQEAKIVEQGRAQIVGDVPDAADPGVDQRQRAVEARGLVGSDGVLQQAQLHLDRREHLRRFVVQLAREAAALLLVLLDHSGGQPAELEGAVVQPSVEVGVLERGSHLLSERHEEPVVERGEGIARVAHEHQRPDDFLAAKERQHGRVRKRRRTGLTPVTGDLGETGLARAREHDRRRGVEVRRAAFVDAGAPHEPRPTFLVQIERAAANSGKRERARQQRGEHVRLPAGALQIARQGRQRAQPSTQIVEHQQQDAGADGEREEDVEVVAPRRPRPPRAQERIVEVVETPEREGHREEARPARGDTPPVAVEHPPGPERRQAEEQDGGAGGPEKMVETVDGYVGPHRREQHDGEVPGAPPDTLREHQGGVQQGERRPARDDLMPVEPDALAAQHEAGDRPDPEQIESPGHRPPGEVRLPIPRKQERAKQAQGPRDGGLKQGGVELDVGGWGYRTLDHSRNKRPESTRRNIPWCAGGSARRTARRCRRRGLKR